MNENLFDRVFRNADLSRLFHRDRRRQEIHLWRRRRAFRKIRQCAEGQRRGARRPRRGAGREDARDPDPLSRLPARRRGLPAAQHRLYAGRARLFHRRRRTALVVARSGEARGARRDRREGRRARSRRWILPARARSPTWRRRPTRGDFATSSAAPDDLAADPLHLRHDRALQGRDADARQSRSRTRWRWSRRWRFTADDVLLHALPIFHTHGLFVATNTVLLAGAR